MVLEPMALEHGLYGYFADVEYNRGCNDRMKAIIDAQYRVLSVTCDLILHARGEREPDNLIAIEMKRYSHRQEDKDKDSDRERLRALTGAARELMDYRTGRPVEHVSGYALGYYVELLRGGRFRIEKYEGGVQVDDGILTDAGVRDGGEGSIRHRFQLDNRHDDGLCELCARLQIGRDQHVGPAARQQQPAGTGDRRRAAGAQRNL
jgi:hypothetical protein